MEHIEWEKDKSEESMMSTGFSFKKGERFETEKPKYNEIYINPNYQAVRVVFVASRKTSTLFPSTKSPSPRTWPKVTYQ